MCVRYLWSHPGAKVGLHCFRVAGMDVANIVEGGRRRTGARPALNYAVMTAPDSDESGQSDSAAEEVRSAASSVCAWMSRRWLALVS